jgi:hypothetical protein
LDMLPVTEPKREEARETIPGELGRYASEYVFISCQSANPNKWTVADLHNDLSSLAKDGVESLAVLLRNLKSAGWKSRLQDVRRAIPSLVNPLSHIRQCLRALEIRPLHPRIREPYRDRRHPIALYRRGP